MKEGKKKIENGKKRGDGERTIDINRYKVKQMKRERLQNLKLISVFERKKKK